MRGGRMGGLPYLPRTLLGLPVSLVDEREHGEHAHEGLNDLW